MKSRVEKTFVFENGVAKLVPKELPNWYGIKKIGFVWHGEWADPEIEYKGKRCSCYEVEDTMWGQFRDDYPDANENDFEKYMKDNEDEVIELTRLVLFGE